MIDLLKYSSVGGCSAKIPQDKLMEIVADLVPLTDSNVMVDVSTSDDAGVYKIREDLALIVTTDFFPAICSDPYEFGQIAAVNSLSDVYAMGGKPLLVLNLNMFPSSVMPMEVLGQILKGGQDKINESGALVMGGHTIDDSSVKYGLAVVGTIHPDKVAANSGAKPSQKLVLTKPLGIGVLVAAHRMGIAPHSSYRAAVEQMKTLNRASCEVMEQFDVVAATDITGFGLVGHLNKMAQSSGVSVQIDSAALPLLPDVERLLSEGCIPGSAFTNQTSVGDDVVFGGALSLARKMVCCDAQTSGGILMAVDSDKVEPLLKALHAKGAVNSAVIGEITAKRGKNIYIY